MERSPLLEEAEEPLSPLAARTLETPFLEEPEGIEQQFVPAAESMDLKGQVENVKYLESDDQESTVVLDLSEESDLGWEEGSAWETVASDKETQGVQDSQGEMDTVESKFFIPESTGDPEIESEQAGDAGEAAPFGAHGLILEERGVTQLTDLEEQGASDANTIIPSERSLGAEVLNDEAGFIQEEVTLLEETWPPELEDQEVGSSMTQEDRAWIHSLDRSAIERLPDPDQRQQFLAANWSRIEFPGNGPGTSAVKANWNLADALFNAMAVMTPERRVPMLIKYRDVDREVSQVPGQPNHKLFPEARDAFGRMRDAAAADGVELIITSSWRSRKRQEELRRQQPNAKAVAKGVSAHMYGLAVDLRMSVKGLKVEANTRSPEKMAMLVRMYRSPVYKWMALRGREFGWFPYRREPWHWEYNPVGFRERFEGMVATRPPVAPTVPIPREPGPQAVGRAGATGVDLGKAVRLNSTYADRLGWRPYRESIASLLGLGTSVDDESFARAVAEFQEQQGMTPADGILGPKTWAVIEPLLKSSPTAISGPRPDPAASRTPTPLPAISDVEVDHVAPKGHKSMNLERGVKVSKSKSFRPNLSEPLDVALAATGAAEGGFDSVNMYDKGILSWGIMQWTLHAGSLQKLLAFVKAELVRRGQSSLWSQLFPGLEMRGNDIVYRGEVVTTKNNRKLREIFRGAPTPNAYEKEAAEHWARLFARAGRHPILQQLQTEYARNDVRELLLRNLGEALAAIKRTCERKPKGGTWDYVCPRLAEPSDFYRSRYRRIQDYVGDDLKSITLLYGMKINNPTGALVHLKQAIDDVTSRMPPPDIGGTSAEWRAALSAELERVFRASTFAMWGDAKADKAARTGRTKKIIESFERLTGRR